MKMLSLEKELRENAYPGRGIVIGRTPEKSSDSLFHHGKKRE